MESKNIFGRMLPYIVAVVSFFAVSAVYFAPQFGGRQIAMHDITQYKGSTQDIAETYRQTGHEPQWTGNMFGGMPAYLIGLKYDNALVVSKALFKAGDFMGRPASLIFMAMLGFFVMLAMWGVNPWVGIVPSLAYGLSTYFLLIIGAGHITKMVALAYAPLMLGAVFYTYLRNIWVGAALTALFAMLEVAAGHPQITYYFVLVLLAYWIAELVCSTKNKTLPRFVKATIALIFAAVVAIGANFAPLWYVSRHTKDTIRGGSELSAATRGVEAAPADKGLDLDYATAWSYGKMESFNMLIPDLMGRSSSGGFTADGPAAKAVAAYYAAAIARQNSVPASDPQVRAMAAQYAAAETPRLPAYWGDQPSTAGPTYIGALTIFLCVMGLFLLRGPTRWWVLAVSVVALLLSWGRNMMWFTELFYNWFPGYNKFRTVSMILVVLEWSMPFVAALMLNKLWRGEVSKPEAMKALKLSLATVGGLTLFFALIGPSMFDFTSPVDGRYFPAEIVSGMAAERAAMLRSDAWRSLAFILLGAGAVWLMISGKMRRGPVVALLAVLTVIDLWSVDRRFLSPEQFVEPHNTEITPTEADLAILEDKELGFRVLNTAVSPFNDATTSYFHRSVGGYSGAKLQRYQDVIDLYLGRGNQAVLDALNTKYIISRNAESGRYEAALNPGAAGAAWFVTSAEYVEGPDAEIAALGRVDLKNTAVVDRSAFGRKEFGVDSSARISLVEYAPDRLVYEYSAQADVLAVFSEIYYKDGWHASIDGAPAEHFRADYILRAMVLPAGEHTVEFRFTAPGYGVVTRLTLVFSLLAVAGVVAAGAVAAVRALRSGKND